MSGIIVVRLEMWKMKVTGIQTDGGDLSVYVYGGGGGCSKPISDRCQSNREHCYLLKRFNLWWTKLCINSCNPFHPPPPKMIKNWLIYAVHLLKFWIFKYSSIYKHFIGTQGHVYIVLTQNETSTSGLAQRTTNFHLWSQATVGCTFIAFVLVLAPDSFSSLDVLNIIYTEIWR